jgi:hypothetical protein
VAGWPGCGAGGEAVTMGSGKIIEDCVIGEFGDWAIAYAFGLKITQLQFF